MAVAWIKWEAYWLIIAWDVATNAINKENSLICPNRKPISQLVLSDSLTLRSRIRKTIGLAIKIQEAITAEGTATSANRLS